MRVRFDGLDSATDTSAAWVLRLQDLVGLGFTLRRAMNQRDTGRTNNSPSL